MVTIGFLFDVLAWGAARTSRAHGGQPRPVFYVGAAIVFGLGVWVLAGGRYGGEFFAGWLTEYSLSIDNLFIFIIIMGRLAVPGAQQTALLIGIVLALVLRGSSSRSAPPRSTSSAGSSTSSGSSCLHGLKLASDDDQDDEYDEPRWCGSSRHFPADDGVARREAAHHGATASGHHPDVLVVLSLGTTDLLFALDSIPAIYGLTQEPYLVFTANVFALMGLRQLYFLIGDLLKRLIYLSYGLSFLLAFIGVKLILHAHARNELPFINGGEPVGWAPDIPIWLSLVVIVATLAVTAVASLAKDARGRTTASARAGALLDEADDLASSASVTARS